MLESHGEMLYRISALTGEILEISEESGNGFDFTPFATSYPGILLNVPFLPQVPPGDWKNTKNCGQDSVLMVMAFLKKFQPYSQLITDEDSWLAWYTGNSVFKNPNGAPTNTSLLASLTKGYWSYSTVYTGSNGTKDLLYNSLKQGKPVVVAVKIDMGTTTANHFMVLIGLSDSTVIVNDPGHTYGGGVQYSYSQFDASWKTQGRAYVVFTNKSIN
jgi:hypothetical protein